MPRLPRRLGRPSIVFASLAAAFLIALTMPIPAVPDAGRADVRAEVSARLPGWTVSRLNPSWEGAYTVVTTCAGRDVSFQFVPGHGLPAEDAWIQPANPYARARLAVTSDHRHYLLWREDELNPGRVACLEDTAHGGGDVAEAGPIVDGVD